MDHLACLSDQTKDVVYKICSKDSHLADLRMYEILKYLSFAHTKLSRNLEILQQSKISKYGVDCVIALSRQDFRNAFLISRQSNSLVLNPFFGLA